MEKQAIELLRNARARIENPEHWTKDTYARTADGKVIEPRSPYACKWCTYGALYFAFDINTCNWDVFDLAVDALKGFVANPDHGIAEFNDSIYTKHDDVLAWIDKAIDDLHVKAEIRDQYINLDSDVSIHFCTRDKPMPIEVGEQVDRGELKQLWMHQEADEIGESDSGQHVHYQCGACGYKYWCDLGD